MAAVSTDFSKMKKELDAVLFDSIGKNMKYN